MHWFRLDLATLLVLLVMFKKLLCQLAFGNLAFSEIFVEEVPDCQVDLSESLKSLLRRLAGDVLHF